MQATLPFPDFDKFLPVGWIAAYALHADEDITVIAVCADMAAGTDSQPKAMTGKAPFPVPWKP